MSTMTCILGSDSTREGCSWWQLEQGDKSPTVFFEKPAPLPPSEENPFL